MLTILACFTALHGCSTDLGPQGASAIAALSVTVDSTSLSVGNLARVSVNVKDTAGRPIDAPVALISLTPEVASVSALGVLTAISSGEAVIKGSVGTLTALGRTVVTRPMAPVRHNFDDGTIGPYTNPWRTDLDFPADPTDSGRGNVARFHYKGAYGDQNRALEFTRARGWSEPLYFKGDFYLPVSDLGANDIVRKLVYWQPHNDYAKYKVNGGLATGRTVVHLAGTDLVVDATYNPDAVTRKSSDDVRTVAVIKSGMEGNRWYSLEVFQQMESGLGHADGVLRVWLDGELIFEKTTMAWSDPNWVGDMSNGVPFEASDIYFEHFEVGDQVNWLGGAFDEYRYWDNVEFSTQRIGR